MPLNKAKLDADCLSLIKDMRKRTKNADIEFAQRLSTIIDNYVRTGTVKVNPGIPVSGAGATTGFGTGIIE